MKLISIIALFSGAVALTACATTDYTSSEYAAPAGDEILMIGYDEFETVHVGDEWGYGFAVGEYTNQLDIVGLRSVAGVMGASTVSDYNTGTATFVGKYDAVHVTQITSTGTSASGTYNWPSEVIILNANFDAGTLTGAAGDLVVNGTFTDKNLGGSVVFSGITGELDGLVGGDKVIGAFHGSNTTEVFAGGFWGLVD